MSVDTHELAPVEPLLDELVAARAHTDQFGKRSPLGLSQLEQKRNSLDYETAKVEEEAVLRRVVSGVNETDDAALSPFQKAITTKVLGHVWRTPIPQSLDLIVDGFRAFERVEEDAERSRGTVAIIGESAISLFTSNGKDDLQVEEINARLGQRGIGLRLADGMSVAIPSMKQDGFPDPSVKNATYSQILLSSGYGDNVAAQLGQFDPESDKYELPFIRLGTPEKPSSNLNAYLESAESRFAARYLIRLLQKDNWLYVTKPGDELESKVVDEISDVYTDILFGLTPRDEEKHISSEHSHMAKRTYVSTKRMRNKGLATYDTKGRDVLLYAAGATPSDIEAATREKVAKKTHGAQTANQIIGSLRAEQLIDPFFERLA